MLLDNYVNVKIIKKLTHVRLSDFTLRRRLPCL